MVAPVITKKDSAELSLTASPGENAPAYAALAKKINTGEKDEKSNNTFNLRFDQFQIATMLAAYNKLRRNGGPTNASAIMRDALDLYFSSLSKEVLDDLETFLPR